MGRAIHMVRTRILDMIASVEKDFPTAAFRVAFVGYRDYEDGEPDVIDFGASEVRLKGRAKNHAKLMPKEA